MSYDLKIWSSKQMTENNSLLTDAGYKLNNDFFMREGNGWQVIISHSVTVDPEDIPITIMQALPGISYMTEINIEPISTPDKVRNETLRMCKALATEIKGVVEDPQNGTIKMPSGVKKVSYDNLKGKNQPLISLIWYFEDVTFYKSKQIDKFVDLFDKYMPDALPRRYGEYEPPQYKFAETGKEHLIDFLKNEPSPVCYATKPFTHLFISVPDIEKETKEYLQNELYQKDINPQSFYGKAQTKYRCGKIELQMLKEVFLQPDWNLAVKRLFVEMAKLLTPFYAEIVEEKPHMIMQKKGLVRSWWWRGIPRDLGYAIILNDKYAQQCKRFQRIATKISHDLYIADCFCESNFNNVTKKVGAVPRAIAAPKNYNKTAKFFPFQSALAFLGPRFDEATIEVLWSENRQMYAEVFKHHSGNGYQFRCMKLDYDDYNHVYCWVPFDSGTSSLFDTSEKAIEEAKIQMGFDNNLSEIDFSDYISITDTDLVSVDNQGITYKTIKGNTFISFAECACNYERLNGGSGKCVGERDVTGSNPSFAFFTAPLTTHIFFLDEGKAKMLKGHFLQRFHNLQNQIIAAGFTTFDLS